MNRISFLIIAYFTLNTISCKENKYKTNGENIIIAQDSIVQNNKNDVEITKLPFGYDGINKHYHSKKLNTKELSELDDSSKLHDYYNLIISKNGSLGDYQFPAKNAFDFDLGYYENIDSLKTDLTDYNVSIRLPNVGNNKVYITNSTKNKLENEYSLINNIDLIIRNPQNKLINSLNISHIYYPQARDNTSYLGTSKYFYIDKDYIIHIKYFRDNEDIESTLIAYIKYKITNTGDIIRYFDQDKGYYKSEIEEGEIIDHLKEGVWKENTSSLIPTYYIKKYSKGILVNNIEVVIAKYEFGKSNPILIDKNTFLPLKN